MRLTDKLTLTCIVALALLTALTASAQVRPGIEVLRERGFDVLRGKRVGLVTNATGVDNNLRSTIDILAESPDVNLVALFAPEHGVRGDITAGSTVADTSDPRTGITVRSLYGKTKRPTPAMLADIDVLVYDIQDNGSRSYTFISTMGEAMSACARDGKEFVVLDRPNPLGGIKVEGRIRDAGCVSFVSKYAIPYIYGLTAGELARYLAATSQAGTPDMNLTVVPMEGWERDMLFADTGMPWVPTSPQMPTAETSLYYPATGILGELSYVSIGVGHTLPFMTAAAPWVNALDLADALNALRLPGALFRPITFTPRYGVHADKTVHGVQVYVTDPGSCELTLLQFYVMQELARLYPAHKAFDSDTSRMRMFDLVTGCKDVRVIFSRRYLVDDILTLWHEGLDRYRADKVKYHIYH